mgnify:CR=1 FL=1
MERKTLPGFICKGDCKNCVVRDWRDLKKYYYEPVFSPVACSRAVSNGFSASVITEAEYNSQIFSTDFRQLGIGFAEYVRQLTDDINYADGQL